MTTEENSAPSPNKSSPLTSYHTILTSSTHYHVKHPLQHHWTLTQKLASTKPSTKNISGSEWSRGLEKSVTVGTIEDFWCLYKSMPNVRQVPNGCDYFLMIEGVEPKWEDPAFKDGAEWRFEIQERMDLEALWKQALMFVVGSTCEHREIIKGVQFANRGRKRFSLWLSQGEREAHESIRDDFLNFLEKREMRADYKPFSGGASSYGASGGGDRYAANKARQARGSINSGGGRRY